MPARPRHGVAAGGACAAPAFDAALDHAALRFAATGSLPVELVCPITCALLCDPVKTCEGNVYERDAIARCLRRTGTDPVTGAPMFEGTLVSCHHAASGVQAFRIAVARLGPMFAARLAALKPREKDGEGRSEVVGNRGGRDGEPCDERRAGVSDWDGSRPRALAAVDGLDVQVEPFEKSLPSAAAARKAALAAHNNVHTFRSIIATYLDVKRQKNRHPRLVRLTARYRCCHRCWCSRVLCARAARSATVPSPYGQDRRAHLQHSPC
jgi:U-box domain